MMRTVYLALLITGLLSAGAASPALAADPPQSSEIVVDYQGRLQDGQGRAISGVFDLRFKLYDGEHAAHSTWSARKFVAVVDGEYSVPLGLNQPLPKSALPEDAWIGVEWVGQGELLRDQFQIAGKSGVDPSASSNAAPTNTQWEVSAQTRQLLEAAKEGKSVSFADIAERAVSADKADSALRAESIGGLSAEQIKKTSELALNRLGEHLADPDAHAATGGLRLSDKHAVQRRVGGAGGDPYQINCPPGHVVTGIKGGAGKMLDSISIICTKLQ